MYDQYIKCNDTHTLLRKRDLNRSSRDPKIIDLAKKKKKNKHKRKGEQNLNKEKSKSKRLVIGGEAVTCRRAGCRGIETRICRSDVRQWTIRAVSRYKLLCSLSWLCG